MSMLLFCYSLTHMVLKLKKNLHIIADSDNEGVQVDSQDESLSDIDSNEECRR